MLQVREMVYEFYAARYTAALERLHKLAPVLQLDMYLSPHVSALTQVRSWTAGFGLVLAVEPAVRSACTS